MCFSDFVPMACFQVGKDDIYDSEEKRLRYSYKSHTCTKVPHKM